MTPVITAHPTEVRRKSILDRETASPTCSTRPSDGGQAATGGDRGRAQARDPHPLADPACCAPTASASPTRSTTPSRSSSAPSCPSCRRLSAAWPRCSASRASCRLLAARLLGRRRPRRQSLRRRRDPATTPCTRQGAGGDRLAIWSRCTRWARSCRSPTSTPGSAPRWPPWPAAGGDANPQRERRALPPRAGRLLRPPGRHPRAAAGRRARCGRRAIAAEPYAAPAELAADLDVIADFARRPTATPTSPRAGCWTCARRSTASASTWPRWTCGRTPTCTSGWSPNCCPRPACVADYLGRLDEPSAIAAAAGRAGHARARCARPIATIRDETARELAIVDAAAARCSARFGAGRDRQLRDLQGHQRLRPAGGAILLKEAGLFTPGEPPAAACASCRCSRPSTTCAASAEVMARLFRPAAGRAP